MDPLFSQLVEAHLRHYFEPSISPSTTRPNASQLVDTETPLPPGILTNNLGISLVIVCTKSDQINSLERDKDFKEEQFDYVQQTLRTIALRCKFCSSAQMYSYCC